MPGAPNIFEAAGDGGSADSRASESTHRKVELQSPADLTYLIVNVTRAAREKIDRDLPPPQEDAAAEGAEETLEMRKRVEVLVDEYIRATFTAAKDSIAINGMDSQELEEELAKIQEGEELEPFDAKLAQRIQALSAQIEAQTLEMANLRRKAPQQTAQRFATHFEQESQDFDARLQAAEDAQLSAARATTIAVNEDALSDPARREDLQQVYRRGVDDLTALRSGMGGTVAKMERAQQAVKVVEER